MKLLGRKTPSILLKLGILTVLFFYCNNLLAGGLDKGFEAMSIHDYFKAKELFSKKIKKYPVGASYGLCQIYAINNNPFYHLDSARKYILKAEYAYSTISDKNKKKLEEIQINSLKIRVLKSKIARLAFEEAEQIKTVQQYDAFISKYPFANELNEAIIKRNELAFEKTRSINTSAAYLDFIRKYPEASQLNEARRRCDKVLYLENTSDGRVQSYVNFIRKYPSSPYVLEAMDMVYQKAIRYNSMEEYDRFYQNLP